jgi:hypothetical protein
MLTQLQKSRSEIIKEYQELPFVEKQLVRRIAADSLIDSGAEEVGSSDVNNEIVCLYNRFGDFSLLLEDYYSNEQY